MRHPGNLAGVGSSHWCVCAACKALPLLPRAPTVPWRERFPEAALGLAPSGSLTHPANAPELPGEDQPSPAVLVPRGEATKERTEVWDRGNGDTELPLPDAPGARGKLPRKLHSYLNLSKDQTARGEGSSQRLPALRTSSADREKRDLDRQGQRMTHLPQSQSTAGLGRDPFSPFLIPQEWQLQKSR